MKEKYSFDIKEAEQFSRSFVYLMTLGVTLGALCFGYNLAVISAAMLYIQPTFQLDTTWQSVTVGAAVISATVSSLGAGPVSDKLGRRMTLLLTAVLCVAGPVLAAAAPSKEVLLAGRLVTGLTFPLLSAFSLIYIAEMSPARVRGRLLTFNQLQVNLGLLLSALLAGVFSYLPTNHWRYMLGFAALPALFFFLAACLCPESPRWLIASGRREEAARVLQRVFGYDDVSQQVKDIEESLPSDTLPGVCSTLSRIVRTPHVLKALAVGSCLSFFFAWSGVNAVLSFCGVIIKTVGFPVEHAVWIQGIAPLAMFLSTLPVIFAVERYGRRPIVLVSMGGCALSLMLVSVGFHLTSANLPDVHVFNVTNSSQFGQTSNCQSYIGCEACVQDPDCGLCYNGKSGFCLPALNEHYSTQGPCAMDDQRDDAFTFAMGYCPSVYAWTVVAGIFLYCLFSQGITALTFTINAEIYPMWARSVCTSMVGGLFWIFNVVITFSFLYIVDAFKTYGTFWLFTAMCTLGFVLLAIFLPETKNRSLEEVEELFMTSQQLQRHRQQRESNQSENYVEEQETTNI